MNVGRIMVNFVNRIKEFGFLETNLEELQGRKLMIVYGNMGVGKSELVKQFLLSYRKYPAIKVEISQKKEYEAGYYLGKVKQYSEHPINGVYFNLNETNYLIKNNRFSIFKKLFFNIIEEIPYLGTLFKIISKTCKEYLDTKEILKDPFSKKSFVEIENYLSYLYADTPFILNIENIQTIDSCSWDSLFNILWNVDNYSLILEYTSNKDAEWDISSIINKFKNIIDDKNIQIITIEKLSDEHVMSIEPTLTASQKMILLQQLKSWDGNIKEIENFLCFNKYTSNVKLSDNTKYLITTLKKDDFEWLIRIYLSIENFSLQNWYNIGMSEDTLIALKNTHLIKDENNSIVIDHDTICSILEEQSYQSLKNAAIIFWKNYYEKQYHRYGALNVYKLLHFCILQNDINELNRMLASIRKYIILSADPAEYLKKIEKIYYHNMIYSKNTDAMDTVLFWLTELYQNLGNYKKAFTFFNYISNKSTNNYLMLKALLLYQVGLQENAVAYCTELLENSKITERMELFSRIIRLESNYTLEEYKKTEEDYEYIRQNSKRYEKYLEYGYFLRNSEFIKKPSEVVEDLKKSIHHFKKFNASKQAVSSRITLGVYYALLGDFKKATTQFKIAEAKNEEFIGLYDMILTNQAVLMQYKGKLKGVKEKLLLAQKYAYYDFNKLAILINLLVYNIRTQTDDELLVENILSIIQNKTFKNKRIICYAYINLYNYYKDKDAKLSSLYYNKIFEFSPLPYYIKEWIYEPVLTPEDPEYYRTRIKWPINFLDEWSIEFDSSLMNY